MLWVLLRFPLSLLLLLHPLLQVPCWAAHRALLLPALLLLACFQGAAAAGWL
jgi:hypothetical protein